MLRIVLDINAFVSALIKPKGLPAKIVQAWHKQKILLVTSPAILQEIARVLRYPKIQKRYRITDNRIDGLLKNLQERALNVEGTITLQVIEEDPSDNKFLACALEGKAGYIVSGDRHLLQIEQYQGIKIVTARTFLQQLKEEFK